MVDGKRKDGIMKLDAEAIREFSQKSIDLSSLASMLVGQGALYRTVPRSPEEVIGDILEYVFHLSPDEAGQVAEAIVAAEEKQLADAEEESLQEARELAGDYR